MGRSREWTRKAHPTSFFADLMLGKTITLQQSPQRKKTSIQTQKITSQQRSQLSTPRISMSLGNENARQSMEGSSMRM